MFSPIIRSTGIFQLIQDTSRQQLGWTLPYDVYTVKCSWWWPKTSPKHVELTRNNKLICIVHLVGYFHRYIWGYHSRVDAYSNLVIKPAGRDGFRILAAVALADIKCVVRKNGLKMQTEFAWLRISLVDGLFLVTVMNETLGSIKVGKIVADQEKSEEGRRWLNKARCTPSLSTLYISLPAPWRGRGIAPRVLNLGSRWRWVVAITPSAAWSPSATGKQLATG